MYLVKFINYLIVYLKSGWLLEVKENKKIIYKREKIRLSGREVVAESEISIRGLKYI